MLSVSTIAAAPMRSLSNFSSSARPLISVSRHPSPVAARPRRVARGSRAANGQGATVGTRERSPYDRRQTGLPRGRVKEEPSPELVERLYRAWAAVAGEIVDESQRAHPGDLPQDARLRVPGPHGKLDVSEDLLQGDLISAIRRQPKHRLVQLLRAATLSSGRPSPRSAVSAPSGVRQRTEFWAGTSGGWRFGPPHDQSLPIITLSGSRCPQI